MAYDNKWQSSRQPAKPVESKYRNWKELREAMEELDKKGEISSAELISLEIQLSIASSLGTIARVLDQGNK